MIIYHQEEMRMDGTEKILSKIDSLGDKIDAVGRALRTEIKRSEESLIQQIAQTQQAIKEL